MNIAKELLPLTVPLENLSSLEGNPRLGDVKAVALSYKKFGQRKPIVARKTGENDKGNIGEVIAGNHQLAAAKKLGWKKIAVVFTDDDDITAKAYALADNRTAEIGSYDLENLSAMVEIVSADDELLKATAWTSEDLAKILLQGNNNLPDNNEQDIPSTYAVLIYCDSENLQTELLERFIEEGLEVKGIIT